MKNVLLLIIVKKQIHLRIYKSLMIVLTKIVWNTYTNVTLPNQSWKPI